MNATLIALATEFQQSNNLDINTTNEAYLHDAVHAIFGLSASLEDEEIVLNITEVLTGNDCLERNRERVENMISMVSHLDIFYTLVESLNS